MARGIGSHGGRPVQVCATFMYLGASPIRISLSLSPDVASFLALGPPPPPLSPPPSPPPPPPPPPSSRPLVLSPPAYVRLLRCGPQPRPRIAVLHTVNQRDRTEHGELRQLEPCRRSKRKERKREREREREREGGRKREKKGTHASPSPTASLAPSRCDAALAPSPPPPQRRLPSGRQTHSARTLSHTEAQTERERRQTGREADRQRNRQAGT
eukprot:COSAG03_NODE_3167_length_2166_cov_6.094248_3_plen_213_part_00